MQNKHLLKLLDLSREEIHEILDLADQLKYDQKHGIPHPRLQGKTLAMIFSKSSTRTRVSFEVGMFQLGGHALFLPNSVSQIGRGDTLIVRGDPAQIKERMAALNPILMEMLPLNLEEIFIYELGGEDYAVRDIVL